MRCARCGIDAARGQLVFNPETGRTDPWCYGCANAAPRHVPLGSA